MVTPALLGRPIFDVSTHQIMYSQGDFLLEGQIKQIPSLSQKTNISGVLGLFPAVRWFCHLTLYF